MPTNRAVVLALLVVGATVGGFVLATASPPGTESAPTAQSTGLETFESADAFERYVERADRAYGATGIGFDGGVTMAVEDASVSVKLETSTAAAIAPPRHSETNVQEIGIGEPDVVKTDGEYAYFNPNGPYRFRPEHRETNVHVLSVDPPGSVEEIGTIADNGRLLRANDTLVVLGSDAVVGYDVSDPASPEVVWNRTVEGHVADARLMDGQVYLVLSSGIDRQPCPVQPLEGVSTACTQVLRPSTVLPADATYTVTRLDAQTGEPDGTRSIVGPRNSVVYMSENALYLTMTQPTPRGELMVDFLLEEASDELPASAVEHLEDVEEYELSDRARYYEAQYVLNTWLRTLDQEEREQMHQALSARYEDYTGERLRELTNTRVVSVSTEDLSVEATGQVPGEPLNQWALDEHNGTLRIATTVRAPRTMWSGANSSNDVYTLDEDLEVQGSVTGMSDGQEVFGVRFVGDTGYVITFRQVDPLHVIDLEDPENPEEKGELKLPGFSRYLHPLSENRLLGIGEEDGMVKAVIFDVSDPTDPQVEHSRVLQARWSAAVENHHAFLRDARHDAFYIPTEYGGQVFSTEDLSTHYDVSVNQPQRAIYVGDYLYVFGRSEVAVIDETTWERTDGMDIEAPQY